MDHPHRSLGRIVPTDPDVDIDLYFSDKWRRLPGVRASAFVSPTRALQHEHQLLDSALEFIPVYKERSLYQRLLNRAARELYEREMIDYKDYNIYISRGHLVEKIEVKGMFEQAPNIESRITLSDDLDRFGLRRVALDWQLIDQDIESVEKTMTLFGQAIGASGLGRLQIDIQDADASGAPAGHHHMGATRMSNSPSEGIVDRNCKVHGIDNLYISGSSVFPTSGSVNPTFTIVTLALRLADYLRDTE